MESHTNRTIVPIQRAALCVDCDNVFMLGRTGECPACGSKATLNLVTVMQDMAAVTKVVDTLPYGLPTPLRVKVVHPGDNVLAYGMEITSDMVSRDADGATIITFKSYI